jgi:response regulator RpfG family c-di-GMP phosphodiesterase
MDTRILCVDDEPNILEAYQRALRRQFRLDTALSGDQALDMVSKSGPYAIVVSDMRMPGMDGVRLLAKVHEVSPDTVRIMLTGNADQQTAIDAVNEGHIFRFLTKPCSPEILAKSLCAGLEQYRLVCVEKELLEKTLVGSVQAMADILTMLNPLAFSRASRVQKLAKRLAVTLGIADSWQVEIAATLSQVGCITVPEETLHKVYHGINLTSEELRVFQAHPQVGHSLISRIPRLETVAEIIRYQEKFYDGKGVPVDGVKEDRIPIGSRILKVALDYDKLLQKGMPVSRVMLEMESRIDAYDPDVVNALVKIRESDAESEIVTVEIDEVKLNMIIAQDILSSKGLLLVSKGQEVNSSVLMRLRNFCSKGVISGVVQVQIPSHRAH